MLATHSLKRTGITAIKLYPVSSTSNGAVIRLNNATLLFPTGMTSIVAGVGA